MERLNITSKDSVITNSINYNVNSARLKYKTPYS